MALLIGSAVGIVAGYFGGLLGSALMRFTDLMMAFPALLLAICLAAILQPTCGSSHMVIALVYWVQIARVIYTETRALAERDFIAAERSLGAGPVRILVKHILPHLYSTIIVWGTLGISTTVLLEATLSYLGVGVQPPTPPGATSSSRTRPISRRRLGWCSFPASPSWRWRLPSTWSATRCATARSDRARQGLMAVYLGRRIVQAVLILLGVSIITFALLYLLPADPVRQIAGRSATPQTVENIRRQLGLDQSFVVQYWRYLGNLLQGDLGRSYLQRSEVAELIWARLPATLLLMAAGIFYELVIGLTMGLLAAVKRDTAIDQALMVGSFWEFRAQFVVGLMLLYIFGVKLSWLPISGYGNWQHVVLPALTLGVLGAGWYSRMMRSSMIDVLRQDYIRTARAKGLSRTTVLLRHALPNAILPIVAMIGIDIGIFMSGIVVVESVFGGPASDNWPGRRSSASISRSSWA